MCVDKAMAQRIAVKVLGCYQISVLIFTGNGVDLVGLGTITTNLSGTPGSLFDPYAGGFSV